MLQVLQESTAEEGGVIPTDPEELARLELAPSFGDDDPFMVDRDAAVDDVEA